MAVAQKVVPTFGPPWMETKTFCRRCGMEHLFAEVFSTANITGHFSRMLPQRGHVTHPSVTVDPNGIAKYDVCVCVSVFRGPPKMTVCLLVVLWSHKNRGFQKGHSRVSPTLGQMPLFRSQEKPLALVIEQRDFNDSPENCICRQPESSPKQIVANSVQQLSMLATKHGARMRQTLRGDHSQRMAGARN